MQLSIQSKHFKIAAGLLGFVVLSATLIWYRSHPPQVAADDGTGEFLLADVADRSLDGEPALALTFTLPLDSRKSYDKFIQVFEMPAPVRPTPDPHSNEDEGGDRAKNVSIVSK